MAFFGAIYDKILNIIADDKEMNKYNTGKGNEEFFICDLCEKTCNDNCICKCHSPSCSECEKNVCDFKICKCNCHMDKRENNNFSNYNNETMNTTIVHPNISMNRSAAAPEDSYLESPRKGTILRNNQNFTRLELEKSEYKRDERFNMAPIEKNIEKSEPLIEKEKIILSPTKKDNQMNQENLKELKKLETIVDKDKLVNENRRFSKFSSMIVGDKMNAEEKKKLGIFVYDPSELNQEAVKRAEIMKKLQKYGMHTYEETPIPDSPQKSIDKKMNLAKFMFKKKKLKQGDIIKFKSKSIDKRLTPDYEDDLMDPDKDDNTNNLINKFKVQFENMKIKNMDRPDKLENFVNDKFVRDKSGMAKKVEGLNREIFKEKFNDNSKLAMNIFDDFGKQDSWQSYTTLLVADAQVNKTNSVNNQKDKNK